MKHFQDLGHTVIYVVGSFTALIGDPTGRSKTRPPLTPEEIQQNAESYQTQVFKILDPERTQVRFNSEWLEPLGSYGWVRLAAQYNVAQMLERRDFKKRLRGRSADRAARVPVSARPGLRLGLSQGRRRARRHRPALQPQRRARFDAGLRARAADCHDHAAPRRPRRRREDVEEHRQLRWRDRTAGGDVRQAHVHLRRADVEVLHAADRSHAGPDRGAAARRRDGQAASEARQVRPGDVDRQGLSRRAGRRGRRRRLRAPVARRGADRSRRAPDARRHVHRAPAARVRRSPSPAARRRGRSSRARCASTARSS